MANVATPCLTEFFLRVGGGVMGLSRSGKFHTSVLLDHRNTITLLDYIRFKIVNLIT